MSDLQMSLFHVFTNDFTLYEAYDCPRNKTMEIFERPVLGIYFFVMGMILISLYIPCFVVMIKSKSRTPAFQTMLVLAIFDMLSLSVNSVITGVFDVFGLSFCHHPLFIFCAGAVGLGSWMGGCVACILLAIDRCVEINTKFRLGFLFYKRNFRFVMLILIIYWVYSCGFTKPLLFTAEYSSWFFDPKVGKDPSLYHNIAHTINNLLVSAATTSLYTYLCIFLVCKNGYTSSMWMCRNKKQIILQAVVLCTFHAAAAYIYVYMQFFYSPPVLIVLGQVAWQWSNGCFCVVYLTLNRTIRNAVLKMLLSKEFREMLGWHVGVDERFQQAANAVLGTEGSGSRKSNLPLNSVAVAHSGVW